MFIQTEETPNPATLKFLPDQPVLTSGSGVEFKRGDVTIAQKSPLATQLFDLDAVQTVFLGPDFVSVTKRETSNWDQLKPQILAALMDFFMSGQPAISGVAEESTEELDELSVQIKELIDTRVRPMVMMDGGDIVFSHFEDSIVYLHMRGACAGCPSSTATLKMGIENMLKHFVPEVSSVEALPID